MIFFVPPYVYTHTYTAKRVGKRERETKETEIERARERRTGRVHTTRTYAFRVERKQVHVFIPLRFGPPCVGRLRASSFPLRRRDATRFPRGSRSLLVYLRINRRVNEFLESCLQSGQSLREASVRAMYWFFEWSSILNRVAKF